MQKRMVHASVAPPPGTWLDLDVLADVELTSEDAAHPVESALVSGDGSGWRASERGTQSIRLVFHSPQRLRRIRLRFDEADTERTQEFTLRWSPDGGRTFREVVRQQYTFSPAGATSEVEDLNVDLAAVTALELTIIPDQRGRVPLWRSGAWPEAAVPVLAYTPTTPLPTAREPCRLAPTTVTRWSRSVN